MGSKLSGDKNIWNGEALAVHIDARGPREDERPVNGLRREGKAALNRRYIGSVHKFHRWMYEGGG